MSVNGAGGSLVDINTTPLIDVMLVLLVMFIITVPVMTHAIKLDVPRGDSSTALQPASVQLAIDFDGTIYWNDSAVTLDVLEGYMRRSAAQVPQPEIHLRPSERAAYDVVAKVLASAQRNGVQRIGFAGNERFVD
jgi:biopolymer transport protein ExbD